MKGGPHGPPFSIESDPVLILSVSQLRFERGYPVPHGSKLTLQAGIVELFGFPALERWVRIR